MKDDGILKELVMIRKLMIVELMRSGMTLTELGSVLGMDRTTVGKMFPGGALAELRKKPRLKKGDPAETVSTI